MRSAARAAVLAAVLIAQPAIAVPAPPPPAIDTVANEATPATLAVIDAAIAAGRLDSASALLARAMGGDKPPALRLRAAEVALAADDLDTAAAGFTELLADPAIAAAANQGLGLARLRQGNLAAAAAALDQAVAADPKLLRAWTARGIVADRLGDFPMADIAYARAMALAPATATLLTNRGYSFLLRNRLVEAEADLARAVALDPNLAAARNNLRFTRALQGRYREAFAGASRDNLATDLNTVGFAAMARGDFAMAETYFNRALAQNTRFDQTAWANLRYLKQTADRRADSVAVATER